MVNNLSKYSELSEKYNNFIYKNYKYEINNRKLTLFFDYILESKTDEDICFRHKVTYESQSLLGKSLEDIKKLENLIFSIGLVECINYYKTVCSKTFTIECGSIDGEQEKFWHKLFYNGLGEFIYLNGLTEVFPEKRLFEFRIDNEFKKGERISANLDGFLVPVGGGKDSVVTLELLKGYKDKILPFVMSAPLASYDCIEVAGYDDYLQASRVFDKKLFDLNAQGFLNGHVPFSAILGFISVLGAVLTGKKYIALSNEKSANEPTVHGESFNHQYSKSYEFEEDFFNYSTRYLVREVYYFSFLRPLFEIDIARKFASFEQYLPVFRSCNRGKKENVWCGKCSKCLFVYIILYPYVNKEKLIEIFGHDILADKDMDEIFRELIGLTDKKPFECVGTVDGILYSLRLALQKTASEGGVPLLLQWYREAIKYAIPIEDVDEPHNVPEYLYKLLEKKVDISENFVGKKIGIIGFGREGRSTFNQLKDVADEVIIFDRNYKDISLLDLGLKDEERWGCTCKEDSDKQRRQAKISLKSDADLKDYSHLDVFFKSPGVPLKDIEADVNINKLTSQTNEFLKKNREKIIGVTGTKGKSTTSTMIYLLLKNYGYRVELVGNIGRPCLEASADVDYYVFELSSHQLELVESSPKYAVLLNVFEEHLDHYKSFEHYKSAKENIYRFQQEGDICISYKKPENSKTRFIDIEKIKPDNETVIDLVSYANIVGEHNRKNAYIAMTMCEEMLGHVDKETFKKTFCEFKGLPHRLEYIGCFDGIDYYDDSISTIPRACIAACESINNTQTLIIGGMDRGIDYSLLVDFIKTRKDLNFIAAYDAGKRVFDELRTDNISLVKDLEEAVELAKKITEKGKAVVLSPAAPSYGFFKNFEDRGDKFKDYCSR